MNEREAPTDAELVRRAKTGDEEAFALLIERHAARAYRIALAILRTGTEAEDAVQESFLTAFRSLGKLKEGERFPAWLGRIVASRAYDLARRKGRERRTAERCAEALRGDPPGREGAEALMDLEGALARLGETHRLVILLHYAEEASTDEIAALLGRPPGTVRRLLSEAYRLLRLYLRSDDEVP